MQRTFKWQINSSAAGKLLGYFGRANQQKALAECWYMNTKRMPRFNVRPAESLNKKPIRQAVEEHMSSKPEYRQMVSVGIANPKKQEAITKKIDIEAKTQVEKAKRKLDVATKKLEAVSSMKIMKTYPTKKAGTKKAAIKSFFLVNDTVYHKTSRATAKISTVEDAIQHGYHPERKKSAIVAAVASNVVAAKEQVAIATQVSKRAKTTATRIINTSRGIQKELTDLELVQRRYSNVRAGNDRAYFLQLRGSQWGGFVIGRIDGQSPDAIFELKHRQKRLFNELRRYEQVQCILYMKMTRITHLFLVETYQEQQVYYELTLEQNGRCRYRQESSTGWSDWKEGFLWSDIKRGLENVINNLNKAEKDEAYREELKTHLY